MINNFSSTLDYKKKSREVCNQFNDLKHLKSAGGGMTSSGNMQDAQDNLNS